MQKEKSYWTSLPISGKQQGKGGADVLSQVRFQHHAQHKTNEVTAEPSSSNVDGSS